MRIRLEDYIQQKLVYGCFASSDLLGKVVMLETPTGSVGTSISDIQFCMYQPERKGAGRCESITLPLHHQLSFQDKTVNRLSYSLLFPNGLALGCVPSAGENSLGELIDSGFDVFIET